MLSEPFEPWPRFSIEEIEAVTSVMSSGKVNYWTGEECRKFEAEFSTYVGTSHAIAVSNGTLALDLALHGLGIGVVNGGTELDEVIVTPRSFIASVSCIVNAGAVPIFVDVDLQTQNITPSTTAAALTPNTKAIICVHLAGWPCDMDEFHKLIIGTNIKLIEDCAQAHGAIYKGQSVGNLGHVAAWSFCQEKIISTGGEGGMVTCNDENLWRKMWAFKDHGKSYASIYEKEHAPGFRWHHESFGTNWRMMEYQGTIGRIQLRSLDETKRIRGQNVKALTELFARWSGKDKLFRIPRYECFGCENKCNIEFNCEHAWYKFNIFVQPENLPSGWTRDKLILEINNQGLPCQQGSCSEVYMERAFDNKPFKPMNRLQNAKLLGDTSIMFVVHPGVKPIEINLDFIL